MNNVYINLIILFILCTISLTAMNLEEFHNSLKGTSEDINLSITKFNDFPIPDSTKVFRKENNVISDSLKAPYVVYIPENYDSKKPTPLIVYLHGGVSTKDFYDEVIKYAEENYFTEFAEKNNYLIVFPMGNAETAWWNLTGITNINTIIKTIKTGYNVDDNRVYVSGFSDGGSGSFHLALNSPDNFAAFYPLNGMISVGSAVTNLPVFISNLQNNYVYAINTDKDGLYPAKKMRQLMDLCLTADANVFYKEYWGIGHSFDYADVELPIIFENMKDHPRDIFASTIYWETSELSYGKCDWIEITGIDTLREKQEWQEQYNVELSDERISFGFYNDREFEGIGTKVTKTVDESTAAAMGLLQYDIITKMDGQKADNIDELLEIRNTKKRGDEFELTILRESKEMLLKGKFPDITFYNAFNYTKPSGAVKANFYGNIFDIQTSRISEITLYIHPEMVNTEILVTVILNGKKVFDEKVITDNNFILSNFNKNRDRKALWINKLVFEIE